MSRQSYVAGFVKAAQDVGIDPAALIKYAQSPLRNTSSPVSSAQAPTTPTNNIPHPSYTAQLPTPQAPKRPAARGNISDPFAAIQNSPYFKHFANRNNSRALPQSGSSNGLFNNRPLLSESQPLRDYFQNQHKDRGL